MAVIIVCGGRVGRNLTKYRVWNVLDHIAKDFAGEPITIVHGGAVWTDTWAGEWARHYGHREVVVAIDGELDGYRDNAPFNRNKRIYERFPKADCCVGFPGGGGTFDMMSTCHKAGMPVADIDIHANGAADITWWPQGD